MRKLQIIDYQAIHLSSSQVFVQCMVLSDDAKRFATEARRQALAEAAEIRREEWGRPTRLTLATPTTHPCNPPNPFQLQSDFTLIRSRWTLRILRTLKRSSYSDWRRNLAVNVGVFFFLETRLGM